MDIERSQRIKKEEICSPNLIPGWYHTSDNPRIWEYCDYQNNKFAKVSLTQNYTSASYKIKGMQFPEMKKRSISQLVVEQMMDTVEKALF